MRDDCGSAALVAVVLLPLLVLVLGAVLDVGQLRQGAAAVRAATDLAALVAVNDQDGAALAGRGELRLAADAESVAREYLARNLDPLAGLGAGASEVVAAADVAVFPGGGVDPRDGSTYDRPTVRIIADVPLRTGLLRALLGPTVVVRAHAAAAAR